MRPTSGLTARDWRTRCLSAAHRQRRRRLAARARRARPAQAARHANRASASRNARCDRAASLCALSSRCASARMDDRRPSRRITMASRSSVVRCPCPILSLKSTGRSSSQLAPPLGTMTITGSTTYASRCRQQSRHRQTSCRRQHGRSSFNGSRRITAAIQSRSTVCSGAHHAVGSRPTLAMALTRLSGRSHRPRRTSSASKRTIRLDGVHRPMPVRSRRHHRLLSLISNRLTTRASPAALCAAAAGYTRQAASTRPPPPASVALSAAGRESTSPLSSSTTRQRARGFGVRPCASRAPTLAWRACVSAH